MKTQIKINCQDEKDLIRHLQEILRKVKKWGGKKDSEGLFFTDTEKYGIRKVEIDSDMYHKDLPKE